MLKQHIDTTTPSGRYFFNIMASTDQFLRQLIVEGTNEGLAAARARGRVGGRKPKLNSKQRAHAQQLYDERKLTVQEIADLLKVDRATIYRHLEREPAGHAS